jgi:hypothetical protein
MSAQGVKAARPLLMVRVGWFVLIWALSVSGIAIMGYTIKLMLR